ncbi:GNAT family N-acetyltransferase [Chromobacterium sp. IIBBL 290-4]|uniref:GNAT family N-acetyltransferase n=1 Tax=Chromobacterium sp. IIBBL 290-4 TaxID=2953890 RepID=UPI0020B64BAC|nr:GNAT family N-acetyltransferase [Chromobacterium sp. IIBBL 290-4]UTH73386.1 GNAT family N-acetyltransferase [Chromobacterium sp. IIBBL 290-4]
MASNIEIKARARDLKELAKRIEALGGERIGSFWQDDSYFASAAGRFKLRAQGGAGGKLIHYRKDPATGPAQSDFLTAACGLAGRVRKSRLAYRLDGGRAHLDRVEGLGDFIKLEIECSDESEKVAAQQQVRSWMRQLDIGDADLLDEGYLELLAGRAPPLVSIELEQPDQPEALALIEALDAYQKPLYPAESHHGVDVSVLMRPEAAFAVARDAAGVAVACGAVWCEPEYGELKRMYVSPSVRGMGVAKRLLDFLENQARARGCGSMALETGIHQHEAIGLYQRAGYDFCLPFGDYLDDPYSVFMRKPI